MTAVAALLSVSATGGVGAQEEPREPEPVGEGGGALAVTHTDDIIIDDVGATSSELILRRPGTTNDWQLSGGFSGDFGIYDPDGPLRTLHQDGAGGDSQFIGRDDVFIIANGGGGGGGDVVVDALGVDGDIFLRANGDQTIVESVGNAGPVAEVFRLLADTAPQQVFNNSATGVEWFFAMTSDDQFKISRAGTGKVEAKFFDNGNLQIAGTLIQSSDENLKNSMEPADTAAVLDALEALDIATWEYINQPGVTHLGPTAQDFAAAFGLGDTTTGIAAVDADGVALAAIQALASENAELRGVNASQDAAIIELVARIEALEAAS